MLGKLHDGGLEFIMGYAYSTKIHTAFWWGIPMKGIDCKNKLQMGGNTKADLGIMKSGLGQPRVGVPIGVINIWVSVSQEMNVCS